MLSYTCKNGPIDVCWHNSLCKKYWLKIGEHKGAALDPVQIDSLQ